MPYRKPTRVERLQVLEQVHVLHEAKYPQPLTSQTAERYLSVYLLVYKVLDLDVAAVHPHSIAPVDLQRVVDTKDVGMNSFKYLRFLDQVINVLFIPPNDPYQELYVRKRQQRRNVEGVLRNHYAKSLLQSDEFLDGMERAIERPDFYIHWFVIKSFLVVTTGLRFESVDSLTLDEVQRLLRGEVVQNIYLKKSAEFVSRQISMLVSDQLILPTSNRLLLSWVLEQNISIFPRTDHNDKYKIFHAIFPEPGVPVTSAIFQGEPREGYGVGPHEFRRLGARLMYFKLLEEDIGEGTALARTQQFLGHASPQQTRQYLQVNYITDF